MATEISLPRDVTDWVASPIPFNPHKHGQEAILSGDHSVVERRDPDLFPPAVCVVYTRDPLPVGKVLRTTVLETTTKWGGGGLVSGCKVCIM